MAGGPGSGKSTVVRLLFQSTGLRLVDLDQFEALARKSGATINYDDPHSYDPFWHLAQKQKQNYIEGRLGMIIDGTARDLEQILSQKAFLESLGYDTAMIFVNTDHDIAQQRITTRARTQGRKVPPEEASQSWHAAQQKIGRAHV